jgi:hypothetical protein
MPEPVTVINYSLHAPLRGGLDLCASRQLSNGMHRSDDLSFQFSPQKRARGVPCMCAYLAVIAAFLCRIQATSAFSKAIG